MINIAPRLILLLVFLLTGCVQLSGAPRAVVEDGVLRGSTIAGVYSFKGIPYAAPPVGDLRWRAPRPASGWSGVRDAAQYAPNCAQPLSDKIWYQQEPMSEDCLTLNVWTPELKNSARLPVMVWIHGGGYSLGSGNVLRENSPAFAGKGVVLVTINYRLSVFGFMTHPALSADPNEPIGNYGLLDVVAGLEWVQKNIAALGGDPANVTIFGESAGAGLVNLLLVSPNAKGLFHRAISQSASVGLAPDPYPDRRAGFLPPSHSAGVAFAKKTGIQNPTTDGAEVAAELRALSVAEILVATSDLDRYTPVIDGVVLPDQVAALTAAGKQHAVPYITGGNTWEASLGRQIGGGFSPEFSAKLLTAADKQKFYLGLESPALDDAIFGDLIVLSGSRYSAEKMAEAGAPVYSYYLSYLAAARRATQPGVAHTDDIAFVLQTLDTEEGLAFVSDQDRAISDLLSDYWVQFAKTGDPNRRGLPEWPSYSAHSPKTLEIGDEIIVRDKLLDARMQFHIDRGYDLMQRTRQ